MCNIVEISLDIFPLGLVLIGENPFGDSLQASTWLIPLLVVPSMNQRIDRALGALLTFQFFVHVVLDDGVSHSLQYFNAQLVWKGR